MTEEVKFESLADLVFQKDNLSAADFEIALAATLATIVLSTLNVGQVNSDLMKVVSILLLVLTLMRRMAVTSQFSNEDIFLKVSLAPLELLIILVFFHSFYAVTEIVNSAIGLSSDVLFLTTILIPEAVLILIVIQEMIFGNYMIWWGSYSLALAVNSDQPFTRTLGGVTAIIALRASRVKELPEELNEVKKTLTEIESQIDIELDKLGIQSDSETVFRVWEFFLPILMITVLGVLYMIGAVLLSLVFGSPTSILLLLFSIYLVRHLVRFYYLAHGLPSEDQLYQDVKVKIIAYVAFSFAIFIQFW